MKGVLVQDLGASGGVDRGLRCFKGFDRSVGVGNGWSSPDQRAQPRTKVPSVDGASPNKRKKLGGTGAAAELHL